MPRVASSISITDAQKEDLRVCKQITGIPASLVLMRLYEAWRTGRVSLSTLPSGLFKGPLTPHVGEVPDAPADM